MTDVDASLRIWHVLKLVRRWDPALESLGEIYDLFAKFGLDSLVLR